MFDPFHLMHVNAVNFRHREFVDVLGYVKSRTVHCVPLLPILILIMRIIKSV